jgi:hypothetical protein
MSFGFKPVTQTGFMASTPFAQNKPAFGNSQTTGGNPAFGVAGFSNNTQSGGFGASPFTTQAQSTNFGN